MCHTTHRRGVRVTAASVVDHGRIVVYPALIAAGTYAFWWLIHARYGSEWRVLRALLASRLTWLVVLAVAIYGGALAYAVLQDRRRWQRENRHTVAGQMHDRRLVERTAPAIPRAPMRALPPAPAPALPPAQMPSLEQVRDSVAQLPELDQMRFEALVLRAADEIRERHDRQLEQWTEGS